MGNSDKNNRIQGFSLVELSIVLVILGLLTGGILGGQSLMRAAELRSITQELNSYQIAISTFQDKYFAIPGDMKNAQSFWGVAAVCPGDDTNPTLGTDTCNGDGNGEVGDTTSNLASANERFRFWQHLANAGLIAGNYTGVTGSAGTTSHVAGENCPLSKISNSCWGAFDWGNMTAHTQVFDGDYRHSLRHGGQTVGNPTNPNMSPAELWGIDTKIDDGKPATGKILPHIRQGCTNATSAAADSDNFDAIYLLDNDSKVCSMVARQAY